MDGLERGQFEGHAFSFIHRRYLQGIDLPVIPVIVNTFDPPNQPTPRRCIQLGAALRELIAAYPQELRVGVLASGGLSHFVVDEELDHDIIDAIRRKDTRLARRARPEAVAGRQLGDPQLADRRRSGEGPRPRMGAVRAGLSQPGADRHRPVLCGVAHAATERTR